MIDRFKLYLAGRHHHHQKMHRFRALLHATWQAQLVSQKRIKDFGLRHVVVGVVVDVGDFLVTTRCKETSVWATLVVDVGSC